MTARESWPWLFAWGDGGLLRGISQIHANPPFNLTTIYIKLYIKLPNVIPIYINNFSIKLHEEE
ncbi:hypothetical protein DES34_10890 [Brevibacillus brevis]|nr:hypothetical protein C7J99_19115 [Brevibacillus brevis]RED28228.1 hypothetical protein DES34_10890 [Brevibacillus brevis]VEF90924.1 Uncharacterised protein [Brevibacillus brevis]